MSGLSPQAEKGTGMNGGSGAFQLPLAAMVHSVCRAADTGSDALYDVMLKVALMVDAAAHTYGMATFSQKCEERSRLKWVEGLDPEETADAEATVEAALGGVEAAQEPKAGDRKICLVLSATTRQREGAAI